MVGKRVAAGPTFDDLISCVSAVKEAFHDEPARTQDFINLLDDLLARRFFGIGDQDRLLARGGQIFNDHPHLLFGLNAFLPADFQIFVPPEPEQPTELLAELPTELPDNIERKRDDAEHLLNKVNLNNMVDDVSSYVTAVLEAFHGEPAKCKDFLNLCCDLDGKRVDQASFVARAKQLFKDHPNLLAGASVLFPDQANVFQIIPPEPEQPTELPDILSFDDAVSYMATVKEAFNSEPAKLEDFLNLLDDLVERRVDEASLNARVGQIFKDHPNLLPGLNAYLPAEAKIIIPPETAKIIIPPEPEQPTELPDNIEIKHKDADHLLNMIKTRFQRLDTDVPNSFLKIMEDFKEGKISEEEVREEVLDLLYYHEDLRREFLISLQ